MLKLKMIKTASIATAAMLLTAEPAAGEAQQGDASAYPEMSHERTLPLIAEALRDHLLDAGSVTNFTICHPAVKVKFKEGKPTRWTVMFSLNAKNSYGGYTGVQQMAAIFYANKPVSIVSTGMSPGLRQFGTCTRVPDAEIRRLIQGE